MRTHVYAHEHTHARTRTRKRTRTRTRTRTSKSRHMPVHLLFTHVYVHVHTLSVRHEGLVANNVATFEQCDIGPSQPWPQNTKHTHVNIQVLALRVGIGVLA